ncbi:hypothetical protein BASA81_006602 [Batrachochytrium salamandrivorans]|nr:hypothetical protein BASA81_010623 [Batrachochytrium salamandrivorans]KAH9255483.1 hypothetical protein BASA81_006602 [Batrachochytrium salamandrivorans]
MGSCKYGIACNYSHDGAGGKTACHYWTNKGSCRNGINCKYVHEGNAIKAVPHNKQPEARFPLTVSKVAKAQGSARIDLIAAELHPLVYELEPEKCEQIIELICKDELEAFSLIRDPSRLEDKVRDLLACIQARED